MLKRKNGGCRVTCGHYFHSGYTLWEGAEPAIGRFISDFGKSSLTPLVTWPEKGIIKEHCRIVFPQTPLKNIYRCVGN